MIKSGMATTVQI